MNLSSRKDYIEPDYINGVRDKDGKEVIRPLTDSEKEWLNKFYEETVVTNFFHEPELKKLNRIKKSIIQDDTVKELQKEVKELSENKNLNKTRIKQLKEIIKLTKKQNEETYADQLEDIEEDLQEARDKYLFYPDKEDHKIFYGDNNARNACIFNKMRITGKLDDFEVSEFDNYLAERLAGLDVEYLPEDEANDRINKHINRLFIELLDTKKESEDK